MAKKITSTQQDIEDDIAELIQKEEEFLPCMVNILN